MGGCMLVVSGMYTLSRYCSKEVESESDSDEIPSREHKHGEKKIAKKNEEEQQQSPETPAAAANLPVPNPPANDEEDANILPANNPQEDQSEIGDNRTIDMTRILLDGIVKNARKAGRTVDE